MRLAPAGLWIVATLALAACGKTEPNNSFEQQKARKEQTLAQRAKAACASNATYDRLKQVAFDEAIRIRNADPVNLDILSTHAMVRVEDPVVKSRDDALDLTVCSGRMVLHIPPGAERAFGGQRQLTADIEYAAQAAADGSGLVYQLRGAEPIVRSLASFDLKGKRYTPPTPAASPTVMASANPPPAPLVVPESTPRPSPAALRTTAAPPPQPTPRASATPSQSARAAASPSFNCRYARSRSEKLVCGSGELAALDRSMSSQFYSALSRADQRTRAALRRTRDQFLVRRDRCGDEACVAGVYRDRMDEIADIAGG